MQNEVIYASKITKAFGKVRVLSGLDLQLMKGERYTLFGANGAGKTTFFKILASLYPPDSGELRLFGEDPATLGRAIRYRLGFMSHDPYLYSELTPWENLDFYAQLYDIEDRKGRIKDMLKKVGLYHRAFDKVQTFSRGMKQRLSLARAILHDPDLVLLDEPYAGLDYRARTSLNELIQQLSGQGKSFLLVTHDLGAGLEIADRCGILSGGRIAYEGPADKNQDFLKRFKELSGGDLC